MLYNSLIEVRAGALKDWEEEKAKAEEKRQSDENQLKQGEPDNEFKLLVDLVKNETRDQAEISQQKRIVALLFRVQLWHYANPIIKEDPKFVARLVAKNAHLYEFLSEDMQKNPTVVKAMLQQKPLMYHYIPDALKIRTDLIEIVLNQKPWLFVSLPDQVKKDKIFVKMALKGLRKMRGITKRGDVCLNLYFEIVPECLRADSECIELGLKSISILDSGMKLKIFKEIVPEILQNDDDFIINVLFNKLKMYEVSNWITNKKKKYPDFMSRLLQAYGWGLESAGIDVLMDETCLANAFSNWPDDYFRQKKYAYERRNILGSRLNGSLPVKLYKPHWLIRAMKCWQNDQALLLYVVINCPDEVLKQMVKLEWTEESFKNTEVVSEMLSRDGSFLLKCPTDIQRNEKFVQRAVSNAPEILKDVTLELRNQPEIILTALSKLPSAMQYAGPKALMDQRCIDQMITSSENEFTFTSSCEPSDSKWLIFNSRLLFPAIYPYDEGWRQEAYRRDKRNVAISAAQIRLNNAVGMWMTDYDKIKQVIVGCPFFELRRVVFSLLITHKYKHSLDSELMELINVILKRNPWLLDFISTYLMERHHLWKDWSNEMKKNFRDLVLMAVNIEGGVLKYAFYALTDDDEVVKTAINNNGDAYQFASLRLKKEMELVELALKGGAAIIVMQHMPSSLYKFENFIKVLEADRERAVYGSQMNAYTNKHATYIGESLFNQPVIRNDPLPALTLYGNKVTLLDGIKQLSAEPVGSLRLKGDIRGLDALRKERLRQVRLLQEQHHILELIQALQTEVGREVPKSLIYRPESEKRYFLADGSVKEFYVPYWQDQSAQKKIIEENARWNERYKIGLRLSMNRAKAMPASIFFRAMNIAFPKKYKDYDCRAMNGFAQKVSDAFGKGGLYQVLGLSKNVTTGALFLFLTAADVGCLYRTCSGKKSDHSDRANGKEPDSKRLSQEQSVRGHHLSTQTGNTVFLSTEEAENSAGSSSSCGVGDQSKPKGP